VKAPQVEQHIINDVTGLNPTPVWAVVVPTTVDEVCDAVRRTTGAVSVGGGRFSMGGQIASPGSLHLDMRRLNQVVSFAPLARTIRVQAGIRWCDIQRFVDPHGFAVKIMQTYANFTVGGSISVNVHGRYVGLGPLILAVRAIWVVLADGELQEASATRNPELFYGVVGGYGGLGVIVEAELELADNTRVERVTKKLPAAEYVDHFRKHVRDSHRAVFHNADLYPPHYAKVLSVSWLETQRSVTEPDRLMPLRRRYPLHRYFMWAISETLSGKWRREYLIDPVFYFRSKVHWRNYEAGYDVAELEPVSRKRRTYVLQEYFVPIDRFGEFVPKLAEILKRHRVNVLNVSVRHAVRDPGSLLAWAREEVFAFVLYYKQRTRENARNRVAVWTRELIDAALDVGGAYYLPYQAHARPDQFHRAYPRAHELFALKRRLDPQFRFRNVIWDTYYAPTLTTVPARRAVDSEFHAVYSDTVASDRFYRFLQNVYRLYPEDRFHTLIKQACARHATDQAIYRDIQERLGEIRPALGGVFYALPALKKQKREMARQTLALMPERKIVCGYVEIGSTGRYVSELRKHVQFLDAMVLVNDVAPGYSPVDILERGRIPVLGKFVPLNDYSAISPLHVADDSIDLVTCYIGLHHARPELLDGFLRSVWRALRSDGLFVLRDHDVRTPEMHTFVSLAHTVFNAGLGVPWETNQRELRHFVSVDEWRRRLEACGFRDTGHRLLQANDPSDNTLMAFAKVESAPGGEVKDVPDDEAEDVPLYLVETRPLE
jgi:FAD/FMN-containing dehydrogenase/SAM-dependent methyltransferase